MKLHGTKILDQTKQATALFDEARELLSAEDVSAEDRQVAFDKIGKAKDITAAVEALMEIKAGGEALADAADEVKKNRPAGGDQQGQEADKKFTSMGLYYKAVYGQTFRNRADTRLVAAKFTDEPSNGEHTNSDGWFDGTKDLVESIGASGGFLVPVEQSNTLYMLDPDPLHIRSRATIIPMRRRSIRIPVLNQTGTTAGQPHWYGGVLAKWTEETGEKEESEPSFRQIELVAHKLVCYTEAGDELLEDAAQSLESLLGAQFRGAIDWYEEDAFLTGTGAGQPLGVINANATIRRPRAAAGAIGVNDVVNMLQDFQGVNPVWMASRQALSQLMLLNGPAGNPSYVFMPSAREGMPATLFGYPLIFSEHCPALGSEGDLGLYDFKKYLVGDRSATTVDASKHYKFQNDITSWRAVHRVDGQPWLSDPFTLKDGSTQVSPFVILDDAVAT